MQIIHSHGDHWIVAATVGDEKENQVKVFDSLYESIDDVTHQMFLDLRQHLTASRSQSSQE